MRDFRELQVWEKAHRLVLDVYQATGSFPDDERYALRSQIRRAASSIPANIAEGCGRASNKDLAHFVQIALGSAAELEYHLLLSRDLSYLAHEEYESLTAQTVEVKKMATSFVTYLRKNP